MDYIARDGLPISMGNAVYIYADSNPTTGYNWIVETEDCNGIIDIH